MFLMLKLVMIVQTPHFNPAAAPEDTAAKVMETLKSVGMRAMIFYFVMQFFRKPATTPGIKEFSRLKPVHSFLQKGEHLENLSECPLQISSLMAWALTCESRFEGKSFFYSDANCFQVCLSF